MAQLRHRRWWYRWRAEPLSTHRPTCDSVWQSCGVLPCSVIPSRVVCDVSWFPRSLSASPHIFMALRSLESARDAPPGPVYTHAATRVSHTHKTATNAVSRRTRQLETQSKGLWSLTQRCRVSAEKCQNAQKHPGVVATKVGYFGVKSTNVHRVQCADARWAQNLAKVGHLPSRLRLGVNSAKVRRFWATKTSTPPPPQVFAPWADQSC
jgi:hypothetical protein